MDLDPRFEHGHAEKGKFVGAVLGIGACASLPGQRQYRQWVDERRELCWIEYLCFLRRE